MLVEDGKPDEARLRMYRITPQEILEQARTGQGIERMDEIRYAVLERTGAIAIIPRRP